MARSFVLTPLLLACGASPLPPATHAHFEAIQRQEARQDELERGVLEGPCPDAARDADESCRAAERICEVGAQVEDRDATLRCERARARCLGHHEATRRCDDE